MIRLLVAVGLLLSVASMTACGGGGDDDDDGDGEVSVTIAPNFTALPQGLSQGDAVTQIVTVFEKRAEASGGSADVLQNDDGTLEVKVTGIAADVAADLFGKTGKLRIQAPVRGDAETIYCTSGGGTDTAVPKANIEYPEAGTTRLPRCKLSEDVLGDIVWEPLFGGFSERITADEVTKVALKTDDGPTLLITYNEDATSVLFAATIELTGLPMGIFLDDTLIAGPTVSEAIQSGTIAVAGMTLRDARILKAQLESGELPVTVSVADASG